MKDFRFAIIGAGSIAAHFVDAVTRVPGASVAAVASKSPERAGRFSENYQVPESFGSYEEMLEIIKPDCVYIATTPNFHYENTMLCMKKGIPVLCEKALCCII